MPLNTVILQIGTLLRAGRSALGKARDKALRHTEEGPDPKREKPVRGTPVRHSGKKKMQERSFPLPEGSVGPLLLMLATSLKNMCTSLTLEVRTDDPELKKLSSAPKEKRSGTGNSPDYAIKLVVERKAPAEGMEKIKKVMARVYPEDYEQAIAKQTV